MTRVDMHVHSRYSARPSEWFLQRLGARESYTDPELIYAEARRQGMDFVTVTDHNEIAASVMLRELHPDTVFTGLEATTYFPENGCKVHVLVYGLSERQFAEINTLRTDIYQLRDYLREQELAHAVAHATYSINGCLSADMIEKLILLFDCFEGINGSRGRRGNQTLMDVLAALTPERIEDLTRRHGIAPFSLTPWIKGIIGGTDDHSGLFIGRTCTHADGDTPAAFLESLRHKRTTPGGRHNDYRGLAFALYKIAYDFSQSQKSGLSPSLFSAVHEFIFERKSLRLKNRLMVRKIRHSGRNGDNVLEHLLVELIDAVQARGDLGIDDKLDLLYEKITGVADWMFCRLMDDVGKHVRNGDVIGLVKRLFGSIPGVFLSVPFFTTLDLLHESRDLLEDLALRFALPGSAGPRRILWFTDTGTDAHQCRILWEGYRQARDLPDGDLIVVSCTGDSSGQGARLDLPAVYTHETPLVAGGVLRVPSLLASIRLISQADPDHLVLATPGPVGLLGLLVSRLLHVPAGALGSGAAAGYVQPLPDTGEDAVRLIEGYLRWFTETARTGMSLPDRLVPGGTAVESPLLQTASSCCA